MEVFRSSNFVQFHILSSNPVLKRTPVLRFISIQRLSPGVSQLASLSVSTIVSEIERDLVWIVLSENSVTAVTIQQKGHRMITQLILGHGWIYFFVGFLSISSDERYKNPTPKTF